MTELNIWDIDEPVTTFGVDVPPWIKQDITAADLAAIMQGGCASGAYMPAVTYHQALETMNAHGDDVLDFVGDVLGELPDVSDLPWSQMACAYVSAAVELWAPSAANEVVEALETGDTFVVEWEHERDLYRVTVYAYDGGPVVLQAEGDALRELVEEGFLEIGDDDSAVEYATGLVTVCGAD